MRFSPFTAWCLCKRWSAVLAVKILSDRLSINLSVRTGVLCDKAKEHTVDIRSPAAFQWAKSEVHKEWRRSAILPAVLCIDIQTSFVYRIIYGDIDYSDCCAEIGLLILWERRDLLASQFFEKMLNKTNCLNYLSPNQRDESVTSKLRNPSAFNLPTIRTNRCKNSFINYTLEHIRSFSNTYSVLRDRFACST